MNHTPNRPSRPVDHRDPRRPIRAAFRPAAAVAAIAVSLALTACGTSPANGGPGATTSPASATAAGSDARTPGAVTLESGWAKAGSGMTAVFGTVHNDTDQPVTLVGGSSAAAASVEVHTMVKQADGTMKMTKKEGGLPVPAGGSVELAPGHDHIMLIGLRAPLENGSDVTLVLRTAQGQDLEWIVPVRSFAGAEETYVPEGH